MKILHLAIIAALLMFLITVHEVLAQQSDSSATSNTTKITVSNLIMDKQIDPNGHLHFRFKITDSLGKIVPDAGAEASLDYQSCVIGRNELSIQISHAPDYGTSGIMNGDITMLHDVISGNYTMYIFVLGPQNASYKGETIQVQFQYFNDSSVKLSNWSLYPYDNLVHPTQTTLSSLDIDGYAVNLDSDNRVCNWSFIPSKKELDLDISATEWHHFMNITIPKGLLDGNFTVELMGRYNVPFTLTRTGNYSALSMKYVSCNLDMYHTCNLDIIGTSIGQSLAPATSITSQTPKNETGDVNSNDKTRLLIYCSRQLSVSNDNETAINLAENSNQFKSRVQGYSYKFNSIANILSGCNITTVNVVFALTDSNGNFVKNLVITEDPSLSKILNASEQQGAQYEGNPGGPAGFEPLHLGGSGSNLTSHAESSSCCPVPWYKTPVFIISVVAMAATGFFVFYFKHFKEE